MTKRLSQIASHIGGELVGSGDAEIRGVNGINEAVPGELAFIMNPAQEAMIDSTKASAVVAPKGVVKNHNKPIIKVDSPSIVFTKIIEFVLPDKIPHPKGISKLAVVSASAKIGKSAALGPYVVVEPGASIGERTIVYPFCYIGKNTKIGDDCIIYPNVVIREEISVGNRVNIHPGSVIGADGFGYDTKPDGTHLKIPQLGGVTIEDDVEIGACTAVDRARFQHTIIGRGSKIDNLVQIAHNVVIGPHCLIAAQAGISGSSTLGRNVVLGGQVGLADHLKLGDFVMAGAKSGISKSFPARTTLFWYPAKPVDKAREIIASVNLLPKLYERVRSLEAKIKELESEKSKDN